jgi:uncharacterized protein
MRRSPENSTTNGDPTLEELDEEECLRLLASQSVGRLAVAEPGRAPHVVPVNYVLLRGSVVFRSGRGTKLRLLITEPVSFEVDSIDPIHHTGWSVLVQGLAYQASDREIEVEDVDVEPFAPGQKDDWVRLMPQSITGRRLHLPAPPELR